MVSQQRPLASRPRALMPRPSRNSRGVGDNLANAEARVAGRRTHPEPSQTAAGLASETPRDGSALGGRSGHP